MKEMFDTIIHALIVAVIPILTTYIANWLRLKTNDIAEHTKSEIAERYLKEIAEAVANAVLYTSQTYVDATKGTDKWDTETQKIALSKAVNAARLILTKDVKEFIAKAYGDLNDYLSILIEAEVHACKDHDHA